MDTMRLAVPASGNEIFDKRLGRSLGIFNIFAVHAVGHVNGDNHRRIGGW